MSNVINWRYLNGRLKKTKALIALIFALYAIAFYYNQSLLTTNRIAAADLPLKIVSNISQKEISSASMAQQYDDRQPEQCLTWRPFVFVKTHKTGSTTVKSIAVRYIKRNSLQQELCYVNPFLGGYPGSMQQRFLFRLKNATGTDKKNECMKTAIYRHSRLNLTLVKNMMPKRARVFTIIRQPWAQFQSSFNFYYGKHMPGEGLSELKVKVEKQLQANCFLYPYLHIAEGRNIDVLEYSDLAFENLHQNIPYFFRSKNPQAYDLGLDPYLEDEEEMKKNIAILDSGIDLVMINEHMDESLIMLKDIFLYRHFNATLWRKVDEYGRERMDDDITKLRKLRGVTTSLQNDSNGIIKRKFDFKDLFNSIPKTYNDTYLVNILYRKLLKLENRDKVLSYDLARYMVDNHGGCPI
ncbi:galactose-3-O-sulfotransferase 2-like isoform X2 [Clavelina lepadiformis]|uniref:galactose-3-O-sulfotransferase 2-like isoform X2 n=1 Tax=Clavelina lepadiformis TaxID=159417 RepID=UPI004041A834